MFLIMLQADGKPRAVGMRTTLDNQQKRWSRNAENGTGNVFSVKPVRRSP